ncbi:RNA polymerase sigma factor (sigma-70 family) [Dyadobacter jejuensis]|uniref:RNA polymerase sigma factor (Sigma-70 family) n=1 Tax=Dyadobacter jejuensis TaxID=1082580 RepID=A0A316AR58_9BACT|nr:RNA polymerase sigma factor [Dyadobacter jejuensis]PWJ59694.1 RNA polymerase sigma factor (sigma-70 family) [Dyadobacter jejuensis]
MEKALSDSDLWLAFQRGDQESFAQIYQLHINELISYGYRVTNDRQLIKDSIQDLFLHLWLHRENLAQTTSIKFYLFRALRNKILRNSKTAVTSIDLDEDIFNSLMDLPYEYHYTNQEFEIEQSEKLQNAIQGLTPRQKEIIIFRYENDFTLEEISQIMRLSNQSVRNILHRAVRQLRHYFEIAGPILLLLFNF